MNNDSVTMIGKDSHLVLWEQGSSKDGGWLNYVLIVLGKKIASYRIGREASTGRWAETDGLDRLYREQGRDAVKLLDAVATAISGTRVRDIPADSSLYRDKMLEALAREVAGGSLPQVTAVGRVAKDRNGKQNLERRIARRLPYRSEVGVLARVRSENKPEGWIGRPPRWWLTLTPINNESVARPAGDPAPARTTATQTGGPETLDKRRLEKLAKIIFAAYLQHGSDSLPIETVLEKAKGGVSREALEASLPAETAKGRLAVSHDGQAVILHSDDIPW